jgi:phosphatidylglycerol:prolipoprotein diacylglycerol transferase
VRVDAAIPDDAVLRVHPTQIYESLSAFAMFAILMWIVRKPHRKGSAFALFLVMMGIERFLVEIVRAKDDRFLGPFTVAQLISVVLVVVGAAMLARGGFAPAEERATP